MSLLGNEPALTSGILSQAASRELIMGVSDVMTLQR